MALFRFDEARFHAAAARRSDRFLAAALLDEARKAAIMSPDGHGARISSVVKFSRLQNQALANTYVRRCK